jgi:diguanylate cyclase (GGDEF)-like protein
MSGTGHRLGIAARIRNLVLGVTATALLLAGATYSVLQYSANRDALVEHIGVLGAVIGNNVSAAITFDDRKTASQLLQSLHAERDVISADLYLADRSLFSQARWDDRAAAPDADSDWLQRALQGTDPLHRFDTHDVDLVSPIWLEDELIGYLHLQGDLQRLNRQMLLTLVTVGLTLLLLLGGVYLLSNRLQRRISAPIQQLAEGMREVSSRQDYSLRVDARSDDEVGDLIDGFNAMLGQIENRDRKIARNQQDLERRVAERTADLAEAKELAEAGSRAKSEFLATMSHEIRTPMNGVLGMTELLLSSGLAARQQRLAETAYRSAEGLLGVINDILDFSKIEAGRLELNPEDITLRTLFDDTLELFADQARRNDIELIADLRPDLPHRVRCDATRLRQILVNLLGNAIKFTRHGEVRLHADTVANPDGSLTLNIAVEDNGAGIPLEQQAHIFDAFVQADSSTSRQYSGTGLGLTITQRLVELMGGAIEVHSEPGKGSRFVLSVRLQRADGTEITPSQLRQLAGVRVLVIDDHATNRDILCNQLQAWGIREDCAADSTEGLALLRAAASQADPFSLVILDWKMPQIDGIELARCIGSDPLIPPLTMIMLSSAGDDAVARMARETGIAQYLTKPVRQDRLLACLLELHRQPPGAPGKARQTAQPRLFSGARILLAEDNLVNQEVALGMLELAGCQVDIAANGRLAVEQFENGAYDLILMDCHMPEVDGFEAGARIRELERSRGSAAVPIVALTADVQKGIEEKCQAAGMDDYLSKPFDQTRLMAKLQRWLPGKAATPNDGPAPREGTSPRTPEGLDAATINQLRQLGGAQDQGLLQRVAKAYLEQAPGLLQQLRDGLAQGDLERTRQAAHSLKSSSANIGALALSGICAKIEAASRDGEAGLLPALMESLAPLELQTLHAVEALLGPASPQPVETPTGAGDTHDSPSILIVDDDAGFRLITSTALRAEGFTTHEAISGEQAILMAQRHRPDLLLLDAVMSGMDGFDTCMLLRDGIIGEETPILMLTGLDDHASVKHAFASGASGFVTKPVSYPVLAQQIRFALRASRNETELRSHKAMLQTAQRVARLAYWRWDPVNDAFEISENLLDMLALEHGHFGGRLQDYLQLVAEEDREHLRSSIALAGDDPDAATLDYRLTRAGREPIIVQQDFERIPTGRGYQLLGTVQDVTRQRESEDQIRKMAYYDALTGLASRSHLMQHLEDATKIARRRDEQFTVLFLDLDGFKDVNDTLGHDVGDFMLVSIARRLQNVIRDIDFVARLGGDEFCIVLNDNRDELDAAEIANRCLDAVSEPIEIGGQTWRPHVSIGLARFPDDGTTSGQLLKAADSAMYAAKQAGKHRYSFYRPEMTTQAERRLANEHSVRHAIENGEFELFFQPQINLRNGTIAAVEALARWRHPERGLVMPAEFIPTLERIGLIHKLGDWAIDQACAQAQAWQAAGLPPVRVAVNISPTHFHDPGILHTVERALARSGLPPHLFEMEITESSVQSDTRAMVALQQLQALGIRISIDDFGTGYSSLGSLRHLPINTLKIDRVFVTDMLDNKEDAVMLGTIIGLAHALRYTVVAEGVEASDQVSVLAGLQCDLAQGYLFSKPVPADEIPDLIRRGALYPATSGGLRHALATGASGGDC